MRLKALFLTVIAGALMFTGCAQEDHQDMPFMDMAGITNATLNFDADASSQTFTLVANRPWKIECDELWIAVEPSSGPASDKPQEIKVAVLQNGDFTRTAQVKVSLEYDYRTITVSQRGSWGDPEDLIIYKNNFDKEAATQTYGSGTSWPYTDQSDCWQNHTGSGVANVTYTATGITVRNNSNSNGSYSDYSGSGTNNLFFGSKGAFRIENISIEGKGTNYELSFGSEKYLSQGSSVFNPKEFHLWIGSDPDHMVEVEYSFPNGYKDGRWDKASTTFTVPEGTATLCIYYKTDVASAYRLDDVNLSISLTAGTPVDLTNGINPDRDPNVGKEVYFNNFDKEKATQTYGSNQKSWPYTDQSDCWINHTGEGVANVEYYATGISVRANSTSDGSYSDYSGSGSNNLFFGSNGMFKIKNIATVKEQQNYTISFGTEKYLSQGDSNFNPQEFHLYIGKDTLKWVEVQYEFANGLKSGRWDEANATVTLPAGTESIFFRIQTDVESAYRLDDFKVVVAENAGVAIDFSKGVSLDGGSTPPDPTNTVQYKKVQSITSGKSYIIATPDGTVVAGPIAAGKNYGYLSKVDATVDNDIITLNSDDYEFVIEEVSTKEASYTIKQKDGRYLYQTGTYDSFNVSASPENGQYWTIRVDNGTFTILNTSVNKWIQYSTTYSSWGSYATAQEGALMPVLYEKTDGSSSGGGGGGESGKEVVWTVGSGNQNWAADSHSTYGDGFAASDSDIKVAYYKHLSTSNPVIASADHIRVYKNSVLVITPENGKKVKKVVIETTGANYSWDMTILSPSTSTAAKDGTLITWNGTAGTPWIAQSSNGQVRIKKITVEIE